VNSLEESVATQDPVRPRSRGKDRCIIADSQADATVAGDDPPPANFGGDRARYPLDELVFTDHPCPSVQLSRVPF
jgi:hypothetical protein